MLFYLWNRIEAPCQYQGMEQFNDANKNKEALHDFVCDLARALAKIIAAADYAAEAAGLESSS